MNTLLKILPYLIIVTLAILLFNECKREPEIREIRVVDWIKVPIQVREFDTIYEPKPGKTVIDSTYYDKYVKLQDSVKKDSLVKDAFAIREYNNKFEDSIQTINAYSKVRGHLLENSVSYETKPYKIKYDTIIQYEVKPDRPVLAIGATVMFPVNPDAPNVSFYPEIDIRVKKGTFSGGYDFVNQSGVIGYKVDLW